MTMHPRPIHAIVVMLLLMLTACSVASPSPTAIATNAPTSTATTAPSATATKAPTATRVPTATFEPAPAIDAPTIEAALRADGYKRYPFYSGGEQAFFWDNGSGVVFYTYSNGLEIAFLNDPDNLPGRLEHLDRGIATIGPLFAPHFVSGLRDEAHAYAEQVATFSGDARILDNGQEPWLGKLLEFNGRETSVRNGPDLLPVYFSLLYREYKCDMSKYTYCYFNDMPSMTYTGGATLTFFDIWVELPGS